MEKFKIEFKQSAVKELHSIPKKDLKRIILKILALAIDPRPSGCIKLSNQENYRIRMGNYRILYSIEDEILIVFVVKIGHRKNIYR